MHPSIKEIDRTDALHVLHYFGKGGVQPGSFTTALLEAISRADDKNFAELAIVFPSICVAYKLAIATEDGIEILHAICAEKIAPVISIMSVRS